MSALGQKQTCALQNVMSALHAIATAKAKFRKRPCLLYPRKRTCAVQYAMSAMGQKRTYGIAAIQQVSRRTLRLFRCGQSINFLLEFLHIITRALQHRAVETGERGGGNGLLYLRIGRTSSFCQFS